MTSFFVQVNKNNDWAFLFWRNAQVRFWGETIAYFVYWNTRSDFGGCRSLMVSQDAVFLAVSEVDDEADAHPGQKSPPVCGG